MNPLSLFAVNSNSRTSHLRALNSSLISFGKKCASCTPKSGARWSIDARNMITEMSSLMTVSSSLEESLIGQIEAEQSFAGIVEAFFRTRDNAWSSVQQFEKKFRSVSAIEANQEAFFSDASQLSGEIEEFVNFKERDLYRILEGVV